MTREISWILESKRHLCLLAAACVCGSVFVFGPPGIRLAIPVLVGGAAVDEEFARSIGAVYAADAMATVRRAQELLNH